MTAMWSSIVSQLLKVMGEQVFKVNFKLHLDIAWNIDHL